MSGTVNVMLSVTQVKSPQYFSLSLSEESPSLSKNSDSISEHSLSSEAVAKSTASYNVTRFAILKALASWSKYFLNVVVVTLERNN